MRILSELVREVDRAALLLLLFDHKGNIASVAESLTSCRHSIYGRMKLHGLSRADFPKGKDAPFRIGVEVMLARQLMLNIARYRAERLEQPFEQPTDQRVEVENG